MAPVLLLLVTALGAGPAVAQEPRAISISPESGSVGTEITIGGSGWTHDTYAGGVTVEIAQNYGNGNLDLLDRFRTGPVGPDGNFTATRAVPSSAEPGLISIGAVTGVGVLTHVSVGVRPDVSVPAGRS